MINYQKILIKKDCTILKALNAIDVGSCKTVFIIDDQGTLIGSLTDGDVRRALIKGVELNHPIENYITYDPIYMDSGDNEKKAKLIMDKYSLTALPVVDDKMKIIDVVRLIDFRKTEEDIPVIIMAGGLGKRLGGLVSDVPKPMLKVAGKPILLHIIEHLKKFNLTNIYLSVNHKSDIIEDYFGNGDNFDCRITYIKESKPLGTGGSIKLCDAISDKPFIVINGDILTNMDIKKMLDFHIEHGFDATIATVTHDVQIDFGILKVKEYTVEEVIEKPAFHYQINGGIYCLNPSILEYVPENEYFEITELVNKDIKVGSFLIEDYWIDIGRAAHLETAQKEFARLVEGS